MKLTKVLALILCMTLLMLSPVGCADAGDDDDPEIVDTVDPEDPVDDVHIHDENCGHLSVDFDEALSFFPPDTVMLSSGSIKITWAELYAFLFGMASNLVQAYGADLDWNEPFDVNVTLADAVLEFATEEALSFMAISYGINSLGLTLSNEDLEEFNEFFNSLIDEYGGREAFEYTLRTNGGFYNLDVFENLYKIEFSLGVIINDLYGDEASSFPDERVAEYASQNGYMMAMHILRTKTEDDTALTEAEDILAQLEEHLASDELVEIFKELMLEHSEDTGGLMSYPEGYLFQHSDMVEPFSDACAELEIGQLSGIVESAFGYHIILRMPIDYDSTPISFSYEGIYRTLRQHVAYMEFDNLQQEWRNALNLEFSPEYNSIDLAVIFKVN